MAVISILLQFVFFGVFLAAPGFIILHKFFGQKTQEVLGYFPRVSLAFIFGALLLVGISLPMSLLAPKFLIYAYLIYLVATCFGFTYLWRNKISALPKASPLVYLANITLAALAIIFAFSMVKSLYPGVLSMNMGDIPGYYRVSQNLVEGRGLLNDVYITEYPNGRYFLPTQHFLATFMGAFAFILFGVNGFSIDVFTMLGSLLSLGLLMELVMRYSQAKIASAALAWIVVLLLPLAIPNTVLLLAVSHITLLTLFGALLLIWLHQNLPNGKEKYICILSSLIFLSIAHPIGIFFIIGYFLTIYLTLAYQHRQIFTAISLVGIFAGIYFLYFKPEAFINSDSTILGYIFHHPNEGFRYAYVPWQEQSFDYGRHSLGFPSRIMHKNLEFFSDILRNPLDFALFCWRLTVERIQGNIYLILILILAGIIQSWRDSRYWIYLIIGTLYFILHQITSPSLSFRHYFPALILLMVPTISYLASVARNIKMYKKNLQIGVAGLAIIVAGFFVLKQMRVLNELRVFSLNTCYSLDLDVLRNRLLPGDVVASDYPQLMAFLLNTPTVGTTKLGFVEDEMEVLLERFKPRFWYYSDITQGSLLHDRFLALPKPLRNYKLIHHNHEKSVVIFERIRL